LLINSNKENIIYLFDIISLLNFYGILRLNRYRFAIISIFTALVLSIPGSALASSNSPYDSGYDHGCDDAGISDSSDRYINQPEKGPSFHTSEFMNGYNAGVSSCSFSNSNDGNNYNPIQTNERSQANCDGAGLAGGLIGGGLAGLVGGPTAAAGGYAAGSSMLKDECEKNNR
jgi:hypothetical protein